jgi:DNA-binding IclR family transcriptional regulator
MTQISPPVARAAAVLNFLAEHAEQAFTLSEIAKSLRMSSATCHNLLTALTETGYVYRTMGKTYVLGPALARVAQASLSPSVIMQMVRPEMRALADEFDAVCSTAQLVENKIVIRERASAISHLNWHKQTSQTLPATRPYGGIFRAWDEEAVEAWLQKFEEGERERASAAMAFQRAKGFGYGVRTVPLVDRANARELQYQQALTDNFPSSLEPQKKYELAYVVAPVFSRPGEVAFILSLTGFVEPIRGAAVEVIGQRLRSACERVSAFIAGRDLR